jgi:hypothetical protein
LWREVAAVSQPFALMRRGGKPWVDSRTTSCSMDPRSRLMLTYILILSRATSLLGCASLLLLLACSPLSCSNFRSIQRVLEKTLSWLR